MRLTKFGHACVRIEDDGHCLVLDPGMFTDPEAVDGATAILITHEHFDHLHPENLRACSAPIWTIESVAEQIRATAPDIAERVSVVAPGESFEAAFPVRAVGELHAVIHPDIPRVTNSGYLIEAGGQRIYHPGDALTPPGQQIDLLCVVVSAPWLKAAEAIDFARLVGAPRNLGIHDRVYSTAGLGIIDGHFSRLLPEPQSYQRLADGAELS